MTTGDVLRSAAARVRKGWTQGVFIDSLARVCALGSINAEVDGNVGHAGHCTVESDRVALVLAKFLDIVALDDAEKIEFIVDWNDDPFQTADAEDSEAVKGEPVTRDEMYARGEKELVGA